MDPNQNFDLNSLLSLLENNPQLHSIMNSSQQIQSQNSSNSHMGNAQVENLTQFLQSQNYQSTPTTHNIEQPSMTPLSGESTSDIPFPSDNVDVTTTTRRPRRRKSTQKGDNKGLSWSTDDDTLLAIAWLNTTKDSINGKAQKSDAYWEKIAAFYNDNKKEDQAMREANACKQHWWGINSALGKFAGCYAKYKNKSGYNEALKLSESRALYHKLYNSKFQYDSVWSVVCNTPKFQNELESKSKKFDGSESSKRSKLSETGDYTSSGGDFEALIEDEEATPMGQQAAKRLQAAQRKGKSTVSDHSSEALSVARSIEETRAQSASRLADLKEQELENQLLCADVTKMGPLQRKLHEKKLQVLAEKYGWTFDD